MRTEPSSGSGCARRRDFAWCTRHACASRSQDFARCTPCVGACVWKPVKLCVRMRFRQVQVCRCTPCVRLEVWALGKPVKLCVRVRFRQVQVHAVRVRAHGAMCSGSPPREDAVRAHGTFPLRPTCTPCVHPSRGGTPCWQHMLGTQAAPLAPWIHYI